MKNILTTLSQLEQMLAQPAVELSVIERDIVLEKLRKLYEQTLGLEPVQQEEPTQQVEEAPEVVEIAPIAVVVAPEQIVAEQPEEEPIEESVIELIEEIIDQVEELPETEEEEEEEEEEEVEEPAEESVVEGELVEVVEEPIVEAPVAPKGKIDHKKVLSLYDDDEDVPAVEEEPVVEEPAEEEEQEVVFEFEMNLTPEEEVVAESDGEQPEGEEPEECVEEPAEELVAPAVEEARTIVLGDVLGGEQTTLAEAMSVGQAPDVASVAAAATTSLMKSVSINDKVLLMRDLFGGDSRMYEQAMEVLDSYESLDEAMLFIYDNFDWNPNSEGAKLLMELLSRKLL